MLKSGLKTRRKAGSKPRSRGRPSQSSTRRTTLTLPKEILRAVERLARDRRQTLSSATTQLLQDALRTQPHIAATNGNFLEKLQKSFRSLTEEEKMLVDGIILEETELEPK